VSEISIEPSSGDDIDNTVAVMEVKTGKCGWMQAENLLAQVQQQLLILIGTFMTEAVYRKGTIGRAKDDLEATAFTHH
jgi:enoyl-[acyl-carrier protein] reductase/trans-2-enoyl-CoA reductase (NAD+)